MNDYIDIHALLRIVLTCLLLGAGVSVAFAVAVIGADRGTTARTPAARLANGGLVVVGGAVCLLAAAIGVWAMTQK
jgi:uncharacterized membrane protein YidH (DUF202 family)